MNRRLYAACNFFDTDFWFAAKYNSFIDTMILLWVAFLQPILKCSIGIKPSGSVFFNLVCHWWQHTAHNNAKKYPNVINFLKSFVQFLFFLLIFYSVVVVFNFYDILNELYFNDDLVILCVLQILKFSTPIFTPFTTLGNEMKCAINSWFFWAFKAIKIN